MTDPGAIFARSQRRIDRTFQANLWLAVGLAVVLIAGLAAAIFGVVLGRIAMAAGGGGISLLSLLGGWVYKPQDKIRDNLRFTSQIEAAQAQCEVLGKECGRLADHMARIQCFDRIWDKLKKDLRQA